MKLGRGRGRGTLVAVAAAGGWRIITRLLGLLAPKAIANGEMEEKPQAQEGKAAFAAHGGNRRKSETRRKRKEGKRARKWTCMKKMRALGGGGGIWHCGGICIKAALKRKGRKKS
jgi:hypothetical protein